MQPNHRSLIELSIHCSEFARAVGLMDVESCVLEITHRITPVSSGFRTDAIGGRHNFPLIYVAPSLIILNLLLSNVHTYTW